MLFLEQLLDEKGVKFHFGTTAVCFDGTGGVVNQVTLQNGSKLNADLVVMGVGECIFMSVIGS